MSSTTAAPRKSLERQSSSLRMGMAAHGYPPMHYASYATSSPATDRQRTGSSDVKNGDATELDDTTKDRRAGRRSRRESA
jgi:hypothetical protein